MQYHVIYVLYIFRYIPRVGLRVRSSPNANISYDNSAIRQLIASLLHRMQYNIILQYI